MYTFEMMNNLFRTNTYLFILYIILKVTPISSHFGVLHTAGFPFDVFTLQKRKDEVMGTSITSSEKIVFAILGRIRDKKIDYCF